MLLKRLNIKNFRSIETLTVHFEAFTSLVGANNSGKSTILKAIDIFFDASPKFVDADFFMKDLDRTIEITCVFCNFVAAERVEFGSSIIDGELSVTREFKKDSKEWGLFSVKAFQNPDFLAVRTESNGTTRRTLYSQLRQNGYTELPSASGDQIEEALKTWEASNPERLEKTRVKGFFGVPNVAVGKLKKKTSINLVPAVKDAIAELTDGKKSPVLSLLRTITDQTIKNRQEYQDYFKEASLKFAALTDPSFIPHLKDIGKGLTNCLQQYYSDAELMADWDCIDTISVNFPIPRISVGHREIGTGIDFVGHGLQRAILFAIMQYLAESQPRDNPSDVAYGEPQSDIILLIEEPEIYQHPIKQSLIYEALTQIAVSFNVETGIRFQVIYTTHSEKLIDIKNFGGVRIIRKEVTSPPFQTSCSSYSLDECRLKMAEIAGQKTAMARDAFAAKLHIMTREVSEGFFSDKIVLVEGVTDKAILEGAYKAKGQDARRLGISILSLDGKTKIDKPALIFRSLMIPTYLLVDNDNKEEEEAKKINAQKCNIILQKICGIQDVPAFPVGVFSHIAFFEGNLEKYLQEITRGDYINLRNEVAAHFELTAGDVTKTPSVVSAFYSKAVALGYSFPFIDDVIVKISQLK